MNKPPNHDLQAKLDEKILILGAARENAPFIKSLLELGLKIVCADRQPADFQGEFESYGDAFKLYAVDFSDDDKIDEVIVNEDIKHTLALPIGRALVCLGRINDKFGFAGPSQQAVDTLTDKLAFHNFCEAHGLNHCKHMVLSEVNEETINSNVERIEQSFRYPFIVKPAFGSGSCGVSVIRSRDDLLSYEMPDRFVGSSLLIEELVQGTEYSCSFIVDSSGNPTCMGLFSKLISQLPYRQETVYFSDDFSDKLELLVPAYQTICKELKLSSCFINSDVIITKDGKPYIVDISPRLGGNKIFTLLQHNGNHPIRLFKQCLLEGGEVKMHIQKPAALAFFDFQDEFTYQGVTSYATGKKNDTSDALTSCFNLDEQEHIIELINALQPGDSLGPMRTGQDVYRGHIVVAHNSVKEAYALAEKYLDALQ